MDASLLSPEMRKLIASGQIPNFLPPTVAENEKYAADPRTLQRTTNASTIGASFGLDQAKSASLADEWVQLLQPSKDGSDPNAKDFVTVANELAASLSSKDEKVDQGYINRKLDEVMKETNSTPAQAALLIKQSIKGADEELTAWNPFNWGVSASNSIGRWMNGTPRLANNFQIDSEKLETNIEEIKSGRILNNAVSQSEKQLNVGELMAAQSAYDNAVKKYSFTLERVNGGADHLLPLLEQYQKEVDNAGMYLKDVNASFANEGKKPIKEDRSFFGIKF